MKTWLNLERKCEHRISDKGIATFAWTSMNTDFWNTYTERNRHRNKERFSSNISRLLNYISMFGNWENKPIRWNEKESKSLEDLHCRFSSRNLARGSERSSVEISPGPATERNKHTTVFFLYFLEKQTGALFDWLSHYPVCAGAVKQTQRCRNKVVIPKWGERRLDK